MQALWLENQQLSLRDIPQPEVPGEALIRVRLSGICGTDLELARGYYPFTGVIGHEFTGEVMAITGSDDPRGSPAASREKMTSGPAQWIGKRVVGEITAACGVCEQCTHGRSSHCEHRTTLGIRGRHGTHAEYTTLPLANLHPVPDTVPDEAAVFVEPLAAALQIQQQVQVQPTDRVLLVGAGRLGQLVARTLALTGCDLRVLARHPEQERLLQGAGIRLITEDDVQPRRWDLVVEATGSPSGFETARQAVRPRGTLVLKSTYRGEMTVNWSPFVVDEISVLGSRCGPFAPALRLLAQRQVDPIPLIAGCYPLDKALAAMDMARRRGMLKVLIKG
ncbi:MAG: alcohol dehydrogenase catalytic domain-containing protein [Anaerolineales bacterium]|nr:alcohol dehydrogenase catalytic domain-containing protein [Anaerolineales bacterium]